MECPIRWNDPTPSSLHRLHYTDHTAQYTQSLERFLSNISTLSRFRWQNVVITWNEKDYALWDNIWLWDHVPCRKIRIPVQNQTVYKLKKPKIHIYINNRRIHLHLQGSWAGVLLGSIPCSKMYFQQNQWSLENYSYKLRVQKILINPQKEIT